jgi:hypothetical protein
MENNVKGEKMKDARLSQILNMEHEISGLLTVTQKELIEMVDKDLQLRQEAKKENRKVLDWGSSDEDNKEAGSK